MSVRGLCIFIMIFPSTAGTDTMEVVYAQLGGYAVLPMTRSDKDNYVYWKAADTTVLSRNRFGKQTLSEGNPLKGRISLSEPSHSLNISNVKEEDFNTVFSCELRDDIKSLSTTKYILQTVSVTVTQVARLAGDTLTLQCTVQKTDTSPQISWLHPRKRPLAQDSRVSGAGSPSLTVKNVSGQDSGDWVCVVTYQRREGHARVTVNIVDLSPTPHQPLYTSVSQSHLGIPCNFPSKLSWKDLHNLDLRGGSWTFLPSSASRLHQVRPRKLYSLSMDTKPNWIEVNSTGLLVSSLPPDGLQNLSLSRASTTKQDRGDYTCAVEFGKVTLRRDVRVEVLQIYSSPSSGLLIGQQINLTCSLGHALPSGISITWIPPSQSSSSTQSKGPPPHNPLLVLQEAVGSDKGRWRCELWKNATRLTWADITLKIEQSPTDVWLLMTICAAVFVFLLLIVLTVILIRRHKQKTTPMCHRKRLCRCKDPKPKGFYRT